MKKGMLKTTTWYKCLVCHTCFQLPKGLINHRMKSQCRFKYKEIHKERLNWRAGYEFIDLETEEKDSIVNTPHIKLEVESTKSTVTTMSPIQELNISNPIINTQIKLEPNDQQESKYNCYFCLSEFTNFEDLNNHTMTHTTENSDNNYKPESFNCDKCQMNFTTAHAYKLHMISIHKILGAGSFICDLCSKSFCTNQYLKVHIATVHKKLKPYSCKQCPQSFGQLGNLRTHIFTVHERLKPHPCQFCTMGFTSPRNLKTHLSKIHFIDS